MTTIGVLHHGLTVSDLDRSVIWYQHVLGLKEVHRQTGNNEYTRTLVGIPNANIRVAQLELPGQSTLWPSSHILELIEYIDGKGSTVAPQPNDIGAGHLAFVVDDIDTVVARVLETGATLRNKPVTVTEGINRGSRACYLHDPDGHTLELMQYGPDRARELRGEA